MSRAAPSLTSQHGSFRGLISRGSLQLKITDVKSGIEKFAQMLTNQYNIRVRFRGAECHTDGRVITLPELALLERKNMTAAEQEEALNFLASIRGYVNHEAGHVLFTDMKVMPEVHKEGGSKKGFLMNALEDLRIERKMSETYRGSQQALDHLTEWTDNEIAESIREKQAAGQKQGRFSQVIYGIISIGQTAVWDEPEDSRTWELLDQDIRDLLLGFKDDIRKARLAESTRDLQKLTDELWEKLKNEHQEQEQLKNEHQEQEQPGGSGGKSKQRRRVKGAGAAGGGGQRGQAEGPEEGDDDGVGDLTEGDEDQSGEGDGEAGEPGEDDDGEDSAAASGNKPVPGQLFDDEEVSDAQAPLNFEAALQDHLKRDVLPKAIRDFDGQYLVYTTESDVRETVKPYGSAEDASVYLGRIAEQVSSMYGPLKRTLEARLRARGLSYKVGGMTEGKLDRGSLWRLPNNLGRNVFAQELKMPTFKNTCVGLIFDCSGSMYTVLSGLHQALFVFGEVLDLIGVPFMCWGFTTGQYEGHQNYQTASATDRKLYTRFGAIHLHVVKDFHENWRSARHRLSGVRAHANAYDGECLRIAARELVARQEQKKFLFCFSDGEPCGNEGAKDQQLANYLKKVATELTVNRLVRLIGVGIGTDAPRLYYPKATTIHNISDLPTLVLSELGEILLG